MEAQMQAKRDKANALAHTAPIGAPRQAVWDNVNVKIFPHGGEEAANLPWMASNLVNDGPANPIIQAIWNAQTLPPVVMRPWPNGWRITVIMY